MLFLFLSLLPSPLQLNGLKMADEPMEEGEPYSYHVSMLDRCSLLTLISMIPF